MRTKAAGPAAWLRIGRIARALALVAGLWLGIGAGSASGAAVVNTIAVGAVPYAVSSDGTHVWVANSGYSGHGDTVSEISASAGTVINTIRVGSDPQGVSSDGTHVWVANNTPGTVSEIDASTGTVINTIALGSYPSAISSDGTHVWVTNNTDTVSEIDAATGTIVNTIPVGSIPQGVSSDGTHVWVANDGSDTVSEIDAATGTVVNTIPVGSGPLGVSSDGTHVWIANYGGDTVSEIAASTGTVVKTIPVGNVPEGVSSDGTHVWVANERGDTVSEIAASTGTVVNTIRVGSGPIGVSSDGSDVWVGNEDDDTVSDIQIGVQGFAQQGPKLVGTGAVGDARQGYTVALSADGNTALVGAPSDHGGVGAVWVFTRSRGRWTQQGAKLVGTGAAGKAHQGYSVALSANGTTALVGAPRDHGGVGAVWVFTRSRGRWSQQGAKLVGTGADPLFGHPEGGAGQGLSVSLSSDGNTTLVGGEGQNRGNSDAVWVFTRSRGRWTQQGPKLLANSGEHGGSVYVGVALSPDGDTALVDGPYQNVEAAWVFTRSRGRWTQRGPKLVGTGAAHQYGNQHGGGDNVALSSNGNTALVGSQSAVWVFTHSGGGWAQQGPKLGAEWGSVALSADGNTAISNGGVFTRAGDTWTQHGSPLFGTGESVNREPSDVALSSDGNTTLVAGFDNRNKGAVWVFAT